MASIKNIKRTFVYLWLAVLMVAVLLPAPASAAAPRCFNFDGATEKQCENVGGAALEEDHCYTERRSGPSGTLTGYAETSCDDATDRDQDGVPGGSSTLSADCKLQPGESLNSKNCGIVAYILLFTNVLSGLVGIVIVIMIAVGGIQYTTARDDPQAVAAARNRIRNAILALVFYLFGFAFLQWLIPGGIL